MKEVAILLLFALMLNGCGSSQTTAQAAEGGGGLDETRRRADSG